MSTSKQTVAIIGNGNVGISLAKGFAALGYPVIFGTRDTHSDKSKAALDAVPASRAASYADAAKAADIAVIALNWDGATATLDATVAINLAGKIVLDATNPLSFATGKPALTVGHTDSAGETVQRLLAQSKVVKAFNTIGLGLFVQPQFADGQPDMFIAGNDAEAKQVVNGIVQSFGWRAAIDAGDITASRLLEPMALLWISYGIANNHWTHGFSLLNQK